MKDIRIFVASSKELERERNELAYLVLAKEEEFAARGLRVRLAKWEYVDPRMTGGRTEDRYLDEMYDCDAAFVLFRDIAGMYTREELDKALAREATSTAQLATCGFPSLTMPRRTPTRSQGIPLLECNQSFQENWGFLLPERLQFPQSGFHDRKAIRVPCAIMRPANDG